MQAIREIVAEVGELDSDGSWRGRVWISSGILGIPDRPVMMTPRSPAQIRHAIARRDWRERVKRKRRISSRFRRIVIAKAEGLCAYCRRPVPDRYFVMDHIVPVTRGGRSCLRNLAASCWTCNAEKSDLLLSEWLPEARAS